jgi:aspartyl-tRNA(Asn)/glutamyl-tRNA(Gln) amidotransferase subunit C
VSLDLETVKTIALLARIRVADDQLEGLARELSSILGWVEQLNAVDTTDVAPMTSVAEMTLPQRDDVVTDGRYPERVLANAPAAIDGFYVVPKVVEP